MNDCVKCEIVVFILLLTHTDTLRQARTEKS